MNMYEELEKLDEDSRKAVLAQVESISSRAMEEMYEELLDDVYGEVSIAGFTYTTGHVLRDVDPIAFRCGMNDYFSGEEFTEYAGQTYHSSELEEAYDVITQGR